MSVDLIVYMARSAMLTPERWEQVIRDAGFPVELDTDFDVDSQSGFLPCRFRGGDAGFEYSCAPVDDREREKAHAPAGCDFSVTLVTHSVLRELATSLVAAGVLCHATGGLLVDPQSAEFFTPEQALEWTREQLADLDRDLRVRPTSRRSGLNP